MSGSNDLMDGHQTFVSEDARQLRNGLDEREGARSSIRSPGRWKGLKKRARFIPTNLVGRAGTIRLHELATKLMQDRDSNPGLKGDLVAQVHSLEHSWERNWRVFPEETRKEIADSLGCLKWLKSNVVNSLPVLAISKRVTDVRHRVVEMHPEGLENDLENLVHLLLGSQLPLPGRVTIDALRTDHRDVVLFRPIEQIIVEFGIGSDLGIKTIVKTTMTLLQEDDTIFMLAFELTHVIELSLLR